MRSSTKAVWIGMLCVWCATVGWPADGPASVEAVLDRYVKALGGREAIETITSRRMKVRIEVPAFGGIFEGEFFAKAPNLRKNILQIPGFGAVQEGFDGTVAWTYNEAMGLSEKQGAELESAGRDSWFHRELKLLEIYPNLAIAASTDRAEEGVVILEASLDGERKERFHFDDQNGLLVRHDSQAFSPQGTFEQSVYFEDYREVDGVKLPYRVKRLPKDGGPPEAQFILTVSEVESDVTFVEDAFSKPKQSINEFINREP